MANLLVKWKWLNLKMKPDGMSLFRVAVASESFWAPGGRKDRVRIVP